jgi:hypothetical protein
MRIERIRHPRARAEVPADLSRAAADHVQPCGHVLRGSAVLARRIVSKVLVLRSHVWVRLERLQVQLDRKLVAEAHNDLLERGKPDRTTDR